MTTFSPRLDLPFLEGAQAQKHVTHNEALERLDVAVQASVRSWEATVPPAGPVEGDCFLVGPAASGDWAGHQGDIAAFAGGGWLFVTPRPGWRVWDAQNEAPKVRRTEGWVTLGGLPELQNLDGLGINASSDATNRLAVSAEATLLNHAGGGHQLKINKSDAAATASLLFQSDFAGHAEMGLAGSTDFSIKVSADGSTFTEALHIDGATGAVTLPATPQTSGSAPARQLMSYQYRYFLYSDRRWTAPNQDTSSNDAFANFGTGSEPDVGYDTKGLFLRADTRITQIAVSGSFNAPDIDGLDVAAVFQTGDWGETWSNNAGTTRDLVTPATATGFTAGKHMQKVVLDVDYTVPSDGYLFLTMRPAAASTNTATRYFFCAGHMAITLPDPV